MATLVLPIALISSVPGEHCTSIAQVPTDSMSTISQFQRQLALGLLSKGQLLTSLTYKGAPLLGDAKILHCTSANQGPQIAASYTVLMNGPPEGADPRMDVVVKMPHGKDYTLECRASWPVAKLKWMITDLDEAAYPIHQQRLLVDGKQMKDTCTLADYHVNGSKAVHVVVSLAGGGLASAVPFADVSNRSIMERWSFGSGPRCKTWKLKPLATLQWWYVACKGLNVEGKCRNRGCKAFKKRVIDPKGMVAFCLHADEAQCPECHTRFQPTTCGLWDCKWAYDGTKESGHGPEPVSDQWMEASGGVYHRFQKKKSTVKWHFLVITARPLKPAAGGLCSVCWEPATGDDCTNPCSHTFHSECLAAWKRDMPTSKANCPICHQHI